MPLKTKPQEPQKSITEFSVLPVITHCLGFHNESCVLSQEEHKWT